MTNLSPDVHVRSIDAANAEAFERLCAAEPVLIDVLPAVAQESTQIGRDAGHIVWSGRTDRHGRSLILTWVTCSVAHEEVWRLVTIRGR